MISDNLVDYLSHNKEKAENPLKSSYNKTVYLKYITTLNKVSIVLVTFNLISIRNEKN